ncbi:DNA-directed 5'-3' RNA polymerase [Aureococcus anophagefferens]|nr:DNA-directed 5'-3' RNA polymerase [Aureococcus anophagefferens]
MGTRTAARQPVATTRTRLLAAAALLRAVAAPAPSAVAPRFVDGSANPFDGIDVGSYSTPRFVDLDGDGDLDLVVGEQDGTLNYYENVGSATLPSYEARTGNENPFDDIDIWNGYSAPALGDVDGDGDLDLVVGALDGALYYFENVGSATSPTRDRRRRREPFDGIDVGDLSAPALADVDGDGDLDLVVGEWDGVLNYYENVGSAASPSFAAVTGSTSPFDGIDVDSSSRPAFVDLDGDGDLDLVREPLRRHHGIEVDDYPAPAFVDGDGDGDLDLVLGNNDGTLDYYENILEPPTAAPTTAAPSKTPPPAPVPSPTTAAPSKPPLPTPSPLPPHFVDGSANPFDGINVGYFSTPRTGSANPFDGIDVGSDSKPALVDLDGDGDLDLVVGTYVGALYYYENVGSAASPSYAAVTPISSSFDIIDVGSWSAPALVDVDGDGDLDLVVGEYDGVLNYDENIPEPTVPSPTTAAPSPGTPETTPPPTPSPTTPAPSPGTADPTPSPTTPALSPGTADPTPSPTTPAPSPGTADPTPSPTTPAPESSCLYAVATDGATCYWLGGCDDDAFPRDDDDGPDFDPTAACGGLSGDLAADTVFNDLYACVVAAGVDPGSFDDDGAAADDGAAGGLPTCASMQAEVDVGCGQGVQFGPCASEFEAYYVCSMDYMALTYLGEDCGYACPSSPPPPSPRPTAAPMAPTYEVAGTMAFAGVSVEDAAAHEDVFVAAIAGVAGVPPEDVSITSFAAAARRRLDECEPCDGDAGCGNLYTADDCANAAEVLGDPGKVCAWTPCDEEGGGDTAAVSVAYAIRSATADTAQLCVDALAAATGDDIDAAVVAAAAAASAADVFESVTMTANQNPMAKDVPRDL